MIGCDERRRVIGCDEWRRVVINAAEDTKYDWLLFCAIYYPSVTMIHQISVSCKFPRNLVIEAIKI